LPVVGGAAAKVVVTTVVEVATVAPLASREREATGRAGHKTTKGDVEVQAEPADLAACCPTLLNLWDLAITTTRYPTAVG